MNDLIPANEQAVPEELDNDLIIQPGEQPPFVIPWCASCKTTVDKFTIDALTSTLRMGIQAECHGQTQGIWVSVEDLFARKRLGRPVVMFRKGYLDSVR